jgi:diaminopimelate decarboxylase/aspartate kinase
VSPNELELAKGCLGPDLFANNLLFTPNFAPRADYERAYEEGAFVTIDNLHPIERWPEVFHNRELLVRVDVGVGRGHHKHVKTAGAKSKFGLDPTQLPELKRLADKAGARIVGLHAHSGSGISTPGAWRDIATRLAEYADGMKDVRLLDVGGGLGVPEKPGQTGLDLVAVDAALREVREAFPISEMWIEPGRFVVAESGVLLARVTQIKRKRDVTWVGVDAGMHSLMRPALYGAWHEIVNLSRLGERATESVHVVGPICESADVLGRGRMLPPTDEGDVLLIAVAGAYGRTMASEYNMRGIPREVVLDA